MISRIFLETVRGFWLFLPCLFSISFLLFHLEQFWPLFIISVISVIYSVSGTNISPRYQQKENIVLAIEFIQSCEDAKVSRYKAIDYLENPQQFFQGKLNLDNAFDTHVIVVSPGPSGKMLATPFAIVSHFESFLFLSDRPEDIRKYPHPLTLFPIYHEIAHSFIYGKVQKTLVTIRSMPIAQLALWILPFSYSLTGVIVVAMLFIIYFLTDKKYWLHISKRRALHDEVMADAITLRSMTRNDVMAIEEYIEHLQIGDPNLSDRDNKLRKILLKINARNVINGQKETTFAESKGEFAPFLIIFMQVVTLYLSWILEPSSPFLVWYALLLTAIFVAILSRPVIMMIHAGRFLDELIEKSK
jgi:hypothetical protein